MMPRHSVDVRQIVVRAGTGYIPMCAMHDTVILSTYVARRIREPQSDACIPLGIGVKVVGVALSRVGLRRYPEKRFCSCRYLHIERLKGGPRRALKYRTQRGGCRCDLGSVRSIGPGRCRRRARTVRRPNPQTFCASLQDDRGGLLLTFAGWRRDDLAHQPQNQVRIVAMDDVADMRGDDYEAARRRHGPFLLMFNCQS